MVEINNKSQESLQGLKNDSVICLSNKADHVFFDVLANPPEANQKLKNAVKNYKTQIK